MSSYTKRLRGTYSPRKKKLDLVQRLKMILKVSFEKLCKEGSELRLSSNKMFKLLPGTFLVKSVTQPLACAILTILISAKIEE